MNGRWRWVWLALSMALAAALAGVGCGAGSDASGLSSGSGNATSGTNSTSSGDGGSGGGDCLLCNTSSAGGASAGTLIVTPATATLDVAAGNVPTEQFTAEYNGQDVTANVTWVYERPDIASIAQTGLLTPSGSVAGVGTLKALYEDAEGEAIVTVNLTIVENGLGLSDNEMAEFDNPSATDPSMQIIYPLNGTVMPLRVLSPEFQWNGAAAGDIYRLRLTSKHVSYTTFINADPPSIHTIAQQQWENIQFSGTGPMSDPLHVELSRKSGQNVYGPQTIDIRIAQDIVHGSVYYWQLPGVCGGNANGKILRIKPSAGASDEFYPTNECWGCHTVSRDGTQLMGVFDTGTPFPMQALDLTQDPAVVGAITQSTGVAGVFSAYNNDGTRLIYSNNGGANNASSTQLNIVDTATGQATLSNAMGAGCGEPAWSPDGLKLAAICGMAGSSWTFDSNSGNLTVADVDTAGTVVSNQATLVPQAGGTGRPAYPSFAPDSQMIAYGRPSAGSRSTGNGDIWVVDLATGTPTQLTNASVGNQSFNPVFAPRAAGGFTWVVFISRRDYGHQMVSQNRQQLWVTALTDPMTPGIDPSFPPFYLRGQEMCGKSENAYYALDPCKADGEDCEHGIECCNKTCVVDPDQGKSVCGEPEPGECIPTGSGTCADDADCCDFTGPTGNVFCQNGFCELKPAN